MAPLLLEFGEDGSKIKAGNNGIMTSLEQLRRSNNKRADM